MFTSPSFDGPWEQTAPLFTTNLTYRGYGHPQTGHVTREFVTSGYFGGIPGDPHTDSATGVGLSRVVTQNNGGATFWVGQQTGGPGAPFEPLWDTPGAVGYYDFGSLTMARTLGSRDTNQVAANGRRVLVGWIGGGTHASQSLARDLTLSATRELLQQFVPELQSLRTTAAPTLSKTVATTSHQVEILATFSKVHGAGGRVDILCNETGGPEGCAASISVNCAQQQEEEQQQQQQQDAAAFAECEVGVGGTSAPLLLQAEGQPVNQVSLHAIVDGEVVEVIFNNRTAMVVYVAAPDEGQTGIALRADPGVETSLVSWNLKASE